MGRLRAMNAGDEAETAIDISPLIDCVFILLIFFIVTTVFVEESGIEVDKPEPAAASQSEDESVVLEVTPRGDVFYKGTNIGLGGVRGVVSRSNPDDDSAIVIQAEEQTTTGTLVRVVDEAKLGGAKKINVGTTKRRR